MAVDAPAPGPSCSSRTSHEDCNGDGDCRWDGACSEGCFLHRNRWVSWGGKRSDDMPGTKRSVEESAEACQARCGETKRCVHFTYWPADFGCHLADEHAIREPELKAIAGLTTCKETCFRVGATYTPFNMYSTERSTTNSAGECQMRCRSTEGCMHFSWWMDGGCHLHASDAKLEATSGVTSGPPECASAVVSLTADNVQNASSEEAESKAQKSTETEQNEQNSSKIEETKKQSNAQTCDAIATEEECLNDNDCRWHGQTCWAACIQHRRKWLQPEGHENDMPGQEGTSEQSAEDCQARCSSTPGCAHFTYWTQDKGCHLTDKTAVKEYDIKAMSGSAVCEATCYEIGQEYSPLSMEGTHPIETESAGECQQQCRFVEGCAHFSWWMDAGCHLQDAKAQKMNNTKAIAGPATCSSPVLSTKPPPTEPTTLPPTTPTKPLATLPLATLPLPPMLLPTTPTPPPSTPPPSDSTCGIAVELENRNALVGKTKDPSSWGTTGSPSGCRKACSTRGKSCVIWAWFADNFQEWAKKCVMYAEVELLTLGVSLDISTWKEVEGVTSGMCGKAAGSSEPVLAAELARPLQEPAVARAHEQTLSLKYGAPATIIFGALLSTGVLSLCVWQERGWERARDVGEADVYDESEITQLLRSEADTDRSITIVHALE